MPEFASFSAEGNTSSVLGKQRGSSNDVIQNPFVLGFFRLLLDNLVQLINAKINLRIKVQALDVEVVKH